jgi:hypothetical protein
MTWLLGCWKDIQFCPVAVSFIKVVNYGHYNLDLNNSNALNIVGHSKIITLNNSI